jgi:hypothetical protein
LTQSGHGQQQQRGLTVCRIRKSISLFEARQIAAFAPQNEVEAALALQAACTHMVAMAVMSRIGGAGGGPHRLPGLASASAKLLRAYCTQVETYRRLRGGGDQNIRVEHVHVHEGGQAIVGAINTRASEVER